MLPKFKNKLKVVLVIAILFMGVVGKAQFRLMVTPSLEIPIVLEGNIGYKPTLGIKVGGFYELRKLSLGLSVGYHSFSPSEKTLKGSGLPRFRLDSDDKSSYPRSCDTCTYTEEFGNLTMIPILIEWNQYLLKTEKIKLSMGLNVGIRIYSYSHVIRLTEPIEKNYNSFSSLPSEMIEGVITTNKKDIGFNVSPKTSVEYKINNLFSVYFEPAINLQINLEDDFFSFGPETISPNSYTIDQIFTSSLAVGVIYNFGYPTKVAQRKEVEKKQSESEKVEWLEN
ncbi:MAG: hypothetical protein K0B10_02050 [Vicingaceae bacterium]|nr:hypothetical protein [Vicingaceae bacterium]